MSVPKFLLGFPLLILVPCLAKLGHCRFIVEDTRVFYL